MNDYFILLGGFVVLLVGGEMLVRGAVDVAKQLGMSPLLIGITLVGFGTSAPELVTSVQASLAGSPGIAVGNFVGSSISNILLILGVAAILMPPTVHAHSLRRDGVAMLAAAVAFALVSTSYPLDRFVGAAFVLGLLTYLTYAYLEEMKHMRNGSLPGYEDHTAALDKAKAAAAIVADEDEAPSMSTPVALLVAVIGLVVIIFGGKLLVDGAVAIARAWGVSETVIGLTIVAVGTSMPELVTSCIAALKREADVAVGNILGSNIYNVLGIGGVTGLIAPTTIPPEIVTFDNIVMVAASVALLVLGMSGRISRLHGALLLSGYIAYIYFLWPRDGQATASAALTSLM